jgi:hypothetical protein
VTINRFHTVGCGHLWKSLFCLAQYLENCHIKKLVLIIKAQEVKEVGVRLWIKMGRTPK